MTLERRRSARHPVDFEVTMRYRQRRFPIARACDLSSNGIYVRTANLTLPVGTLVEIELERWGREWLIPTVVVHGDVQGVGLMFRTPQPEFVRYATAALTAPQRAFVANRGIAAAAT